MDYPQFTHGLYSLLRVLFSRPNAEDEGGAEGGNEGCGGGSGGSGGGSSGGESGASSSSSTIAVLSAEQKREALIAQALRPEG